MPVPVPDYRARDNSPLTSRRQQYYLRSIPFPWPEIFRNNILLVGTSGDQRVHLQSNINPLAKILRRGANVFGKF
ncbi:hypothetical protein J27TS7_24450 [Paenibacillus dendritiformis]|nr:hypothetical protein J27TS7_24450 [Paenibacillus dendritiformis]